MKRCWFALSLLLGGSALSALPVSNPADASLLYDGLFLEGNCADLCDPCVTWRDALSVRIGFYGDYVFNRYLKVNDSPLSRPIQKSKLVTNAGYLALNFWDRVDLFGTLGATSFTLSSGAEAFNPALYGHRYEVVSHSRFSWSIGSRATLAECGCTSLGLEAQFFSTRPTISYAGPLSGAAGYPDEGLCGKYQEVQVGLGLTYRIQMLMPYIALKWSQARLSFGEATVTPGATLYRLVSAKAWGFAVGVSLLDCEKAALTAEVRLADEQAAYVQGQLRF